MEKIDYNQSEFSLGHFLDKNEVLTELSINGYPILVIFWNLFLIIIPWLLCGSLARYRRKTKFKKPIHKLIAIFLGLLWLLFIPNAAYIITDVRHILDICPANSPHNVCLPNAWMMMFYFTYAVLGWVAFVYLIRQMNDLVAKIWHKQAAIWFRVVIMPITALGLLLGLINRWNSWELFTTPISLFKTLLLYITDLNYFMNWLLFSVFLYILYWMGNLIFKQFKKINKPFK